MTEPHWPNVTLPADRLPGHQLLLGAEDAEAARQPRRGRSQAARDLREARHPAQRAEAARRRRGRRDLRLVSVGTTFKEKLAEARASSSARSARRCASIPSWCGSTSARSCRTATTSSRRSTRRCSPTARSCYIPKGVRCPMELSTYFRINARGHGPVRAHADHRRRGRVRELPRGLHRAQARREPAARGGGRAGRARRAPRSSTRPCRTGTPATRRAGAASTTSSPSAASAPARTRRSRWTQVETGSAITWKYPERDPAGRQLGRRVLLGGGGEQPAAGRHRHEDDPHRQEHPSTIVSKGISAGRGQQHLPRPGEGAAEGGGRAQLHPVRLDADRQPLRRAHVPVHRGAEQRPRRWSTRPRPRRSARTRSSTASSAGLNTENAVSMIVNGFCKEVFKELPMEFAVEAQKLLGDQPRRQRRMTRRRRRNDECSRSETSARARATRRSSRASTSRSTPARCTRSWGRTARARARWRRCSPATRPTRSPAARSRYDGQDLLELEPEERAQAGVFLAFQYPVEIPGVTNAYFLRAAYNEIRKARGEEELDPMEFLDLLEEKLKLVEMDPEIMQPRRSTRASRAARRSATRSSRWRCSSRSSRSSTRPTPASTSTRSASWPTASTSCARPDNATIVVTHYQRLLNYIVPDFVHVLADGRIVKSGGKELALELEARGYDWLEDAAWEPRHDRGVRAGVRGPGRHGDAPRAPTWLEPIRRAAMERFARDRASRRRGTRTGASRRSAPIAQGTWRPAHAPARRSSTREQLAPFVFGHADWTDAGLRERRLQRGAERRRAAAGRRPGEQPGRRASRDGADARERHLTRHAPVEGSPLHRAQHGLPGRRRRGARRGAEWTWPRRSTCSSSPTAEAGGTRRPIRATSSWSSAAPGRRSSRAT